MSMTRSMAVLALSGLMCVGLGQGLEKQPAGQPGLPAGHPQLPAPGPAANWPKAKAEDVASIDAIMKAFYESVAGEPGQTRQWERYQSLFVPDARLIPARSGASGATALYLTVAEYIDANRVYFEKGGFFDTEVARRTEEFGNIAQVWSTYESRRKKDQAQPYSRGINSIQLLKDGDRWWIVNVFWEYERPDNALPEKYLSSPR